jgi:cyanate permease
MNSSWRASLAQRLPFYYGWSVFTLRLAWADYYGRQHLGTIQGVTLPIQIGGQALGPIIAGTAFDAFGGYYGAFIFFAGAVAMASLLVLSAVPPSSATVQRPVNTVGPE